MERSACDNPLLSGEYLHGDVAFAVLQYVDRLLVGKTLQRDAVDGKDLSGGKQLIEGNE